MSEFAEYNGERVQIGTCENMYYLTLDQVPLVKYKHGFDGYNFRIPFLDEAHLEPGDNVDFNRGWCLPGFDVDTLNSDDHPAYIHVTVHTGLTMMIRCNHGQGKVDVSGEDLYDMHFHHTNNVELYQLKLVSRAEKEVLPVIRCKYCERKWVSNWESVIPHVKCDYELTKLIAYRDKKFTL